MENINLIFDIGYNLGDFSKKLLNTYPTTYIVGVEANQNIIPHAFKHDHIVIINAAVSNKNNEYIDFFINPIHTISTANKKWMEGRFKGLTWNTPIKIPTITIDCLIENYGAPNIIKIDVEGYEYSVLQGLSKKTGMLLFEWTEETFYSETILCIEYIKSIGYTKFYYTTDIDEIGGIVEKPFVGWDDIDIQKNIIPERKSNWGMIYAI